jgi:hypothetical protein
MAKKPHLKFNAIRRYICLLCAGACLSLLGMGCVFTPTRPAPNAGKPPFVPPTFSPTKIPTPSLVPTEAVPTSSPDCVNLLSFLEDVTVPDGSSFAPAQKIDKQWRVENSGTCNWTKGYTLRLTAGPEMGNPVEQSLYPARSGSQVVIQLNLVAPVQPGNHRSAWQAYSPQGQPFGDPIYIDIVVEEP